MAEVDVGFWNSAWKIIYGLCVIAGGWVALSIIMNQLRPVWARRYWLGRHWPQLVPSWRGAKDFRRFVKLLGQIQGKARK